jgi:hypothetical protein
MATLPDGFTQRGAPSSDSNRTIATADASAFDRGVEKLGQGVEKLGAGVGAYASEIQKQNNAVWTSQNISDLHIGAVVEMENARRSAKPGDTEWVGRYIQDLDKKIEDTAASAPNGLAGDQFRRHAASQRTSLVEHAIKSGAHQKDNFTTDSLAKSFDRSGQAVQRDPSQLAPLLQSQEEALSNSGLPPEKVTELGNHLRVTLNQAALYGMPAQERLDAVRRNGGFTIRDPKIASIIERHAIENGLDPELAKRVAAIESGGNPRAQNGSYGGLFALDRRTFAGNLHDPEQNAAAGVRSLKRNIETYRNTYGRNPSATDIYMSHQQGDAGWAAHLANPDAPAWQNMRSTGEGRQKGERWAKLAIWGNIPDDVKRQFPGGVESVTSRQFADLWSRKVEGKVSYAGGNPADALPSHVLTQIENKTIQELRAEQAQAQAAFAIKLQDDQAEVARTGALSNPATPDQFNQINGPEAGPAAYAQYHAMVRLGEDQHKLAAMAPAERRGLVDSYKPSVGPGFDQASKRHDTLVKAWQAVEKEQSDDPAAFAIRRLPVVQQAYQAMQSASPQDRQAAARDYAVKTMQEQRRVGVDQNSVQLLPKDYSENLKAALHNSSRNDGKDGQPNVAQRIQSEAKMWGEHWPQVYRQLAKDVEPVVRVIGSGIEPGAANRLAQLSPVPLSMIMKEEDTERRKTIQDGVRTAFRPFLASLAGNRGTTALYNDFVGQAEKLAADYVAHGASPTDAANRVFKEMLGGKYTFVGSDPASSGDKYRIPKEIPHAPLAITSGAGIARQALSAADISPPADGGMGEEYRTNAKLSGIKRDGIWITAPDESGLMLAHNDEVVRRRDGGPMVLTWDQLAEQNIKAAELYP